MWSQVISLCKRYFPHGYDAKWSYKSTQSIETEDTAVQNLMTKSAIHCMQQGYCFLMFHCWSYDRGLKLPFLEDAGSR